MAVRDIIVIGASAGGLEALRKLTGALPDDLAAAVFVVLHIGARQSSLPRILGAAGPLPALHPADGDPIRPGHLYIAPPDHHLLVAPGLIRLSRGPRENRTRPAADPLFRSAARSYGPRVIGVVLSGLLNDGTAGLSEIKSQGGVAVVQDPDDALYPAMPRSALCNVAVDHCLPVSRMAALLAGLTVGAAEAAPGDGGIGDHDQPREQAREQAVMPGGYELNQPVTLTCPDCGGSMRETTVDSLPYYTCHIGHRFAADDMSEAQSRKLEEALGVALRALNERTALCRRLADTALAKGHVRAAERWEAARQEVEEKAAVLRAVLEKGWDRPAPVDSPEPDGPAE